jgi:hypothetical protein
MMSYWKISFTSSYCITYLLVQSRACRRTRRCRTWRYWCSQSWSCKGFALLSLRSWYSGCRQSLRNSILKKIVTGILTNTGYRYRYPVSMRAGRKSYICVCYLATVQRMHRIIRPRRISGLISGIRLLDLPDIRSNQYPVHPYAVLQLFLYKTSTGIGPIKPCSGQYRRRNWYPVPGTNM